MKPSEVLHWRRRLVVQATLQLARGVPPRELHEILTDLATIVFLDGSIAN